MVRKRVRGFAPVAGRDAEILILGSMPGQESLRQGRYYAFKHNAFWRIVVELLRLNTGATYRERIRALHASRIALWDVLESCERNGSSDTMIENEIANDFPNFFRYHPKIAQVFFNGAKAEACFKRHVAKKLEAHVLNYRRLPSTSPAHASLSFERKLRAWRVILASGRAHRRRA